MSNKENLLLCDIRVIDLFCTHGLHGQCFLLLQLTQSEKASQELCAEAGQRVCWILPHPAGEKVMERNGSRRSHSHNSKI